MSCYENLAMPLRERFGYSQSEVRYKVTHALSEVSLENVDSLYPHEISGGMKKRLGIARAIVLDPDIILYDEPTAGLDPITSRTIVKLLIQMKERYSMTTIVVTSDVTLAFQLSDRIGFLYQGNMLEVGSVDGIRHSENPVIRQFVRGLLEGPLTHHV